MKKALVYKIQFCILILLSINATAQLKLNSTKQLLTGKPTITLPKSAYFEPAINSFSLLNNVKTQLKLYPKKEFLGALPSSPKVFNIEPHSMNYLLPLIINGQIIASNEFSHFYKSSVDNMVCVAPGNQIKFHINIYNPTNSLDYPADNMPNASRGPNLTR